MQRIPSSFLLILSCLCLFLHPRNVVLADDAAPVCDAEMKSGVCANLGIVSYPFGDAAPCAASDSFRLNCSSSPPSWDAFSQAFGGDERTTTYIAGIAQLNNFTYINLTWSRDSSTSLDPCYPLHGDEVDTYIPKSINLTSFADRSLLLSYHNHVLLLNCSSLPPSSPGMDINSPICRGYQDQCRTLIDTPCAEIVVPTQQLSVPQALQSFSCSHFQFLVTVYDSSAISTWQPGQIQLVYTNGNDKCAACYISGGSCLFPNRTFQGCLCQKNQFSDTDCDHIKGRCESLSCNIGAKLAIGTGVAATAVIVTGFVLLLYRRTKRGFFATFVPSISTRQRTFKSSKFLIGYGDLYGLTECPIEYQYASIVLATNSFSNLLGEGGFGAVYKGTLDDAKDDVHAHIAVKVLQVRSKHTKKQFLNELASIGRIHHVNVVRLLGFCIEEHQEMLVYEYVINGSLDKWLFHRSGSRNQVLLCWQQRYDIAIEIAKGLSYLHEECRHHIVHCDIKPENILLDEQMRPKIADFGLARLMSRDESRVTTCARGTPGYMGPEFWLGGESQLSTKFDVYSYGMVLLELISGHRNFGHGVNIPEAAFEATMAGNFESIMDARLDIAKTSGDDCIKQDGMQQQQIQTALLVALWCIQDHPTNRPSMRQVVQYLEGIAPINEQPPRPTIAALTTSIAAHQQYPHLSGDLHYDITPISGGR